MKTEIIKSPKKGNPVEEDRWINVHDDNVMREMGFNRPTLQAPRDKSVWTKTPYEKRILRTVKHSVKGDLHFHTYPVKHTPVRGKLIIQLKKGHRFPKSTYSIECWVYEIGDILMKYYRTNRKTGCSECIVSKYSFNGQTYRPDERPFWR